MVQKSLLKVEGCSVSDHFVVGLIELGTSHPVRSFLCALIHADQFVGPAKSHSICDFICYTVTNYPMFIISPFKNCSEVCLYTNQNNYLWFLKKKTIVCAKEDHRVCKRRPSCVHIVSYTAEGATSEMIEEPNVFTLPVSMEGDK